MKYMDINPNWIYKLYWCLQLYVKIENLIQKNCCLESLEKYEYVHLFP